MNNSPSLLFVGEAMLELTNKTDISLGKSFAGDVYNTAVYLTRAFPQYQTQFLSALGTDKISDEFAARVASENIGTDFLARSSSHHMGIYMVVNDETGERSFIYWRNDSAAKRLMTNISKLLNKLTFAKDDVLFFSGITIAVLQEAERNLFWNFIQKAKSEGVKIVFDPNYRPALWNSVDLAKSEIEKAFSLSDWALPGLDDFKTLYQLNTIEQCIEFCQQYEFEELVIKQGSDEVHIITGDGHEINPIIASDNVVDTTSAGDAFNGAYLGARISGKSSKYATRFANYCASKVISTPGAIMPKELFEKALNEWPEDD